MFHCGHKKLGSSFENSHAQIITYRCVSDVQYTSNFGERLAGASEDDLVQAI